MTARGAVVVMFSVFFAGTLAAGWLHAELLAGLTFVAGCALAACYTRREAMLTLAVTPPGLFMGALVVSELLSSHADTVRRTLTSAAEGTILTLAAVAPWLFAGMIVVLIIAMLRGLPQCVRDLRSELRSDPGLRGPARREPAAPAAQPPARPGQREPAAPGQGEPPARRSLMPPE